MHNNTQEHVTTVPQYVQDGRVSEIGLWQKWKLGRLFVFNTDEMNECERVIEMIKELSVGINGFNESEIADILSFISTMISGNVILNLILN